MENCYFVLQIQFYCSPYCPDLPEAVPEKKITVQYSTIHNRNVQNRTVQQPPLSFRCRYSVGFVYSEFINILREFL